MLFSRARRACVLFVLLTAGGCSLMERPPFVLVGSAVRTASDPAVNGPHSGPYDPVQKAALETDLEGEHDADSTPLMALEGERLSQALEGPAPAIRIPRRPRGDEPSTGDEEKQEDTNLDRGRAQRRGGGGGRTRIEEEEDEENEEDEFKSDLLVKLLGMEESDVGLFGWLQGSITGNPARPHDRLNFGVNPNSRANDWQFQQLYFVVERLVEESDKVNFGYRLDTLIGTDYSQFHAVGFFDNVFPPNGYGLDFVQLYGQVHLPILTEGGVDVIGGRFYSLAGYEDGRAPARPLNSTTYLFGYAHPFTHFGMMSTWHVTDQLNVYNGAVNGWDRWIDQNYRWGYSGGFSWDSKDARTEFTFILTAAPVQFPFFFPTNYQLTPNGVVSPPFLAGRRNITYSQDNPVLFSSVLIHKWTEDFTVVLETDEGFEANVPGFGAGGTPRNSEWYGLGWWFLYEFTDHLTGVYRGDVFRDDGGARTGFSNTFYEMTLGAIYKPVTWFWLRPEIRWDWTTGQPAYNEDTSKHQFTFGFDAIFLF